MYEQQRQNSSQIIANLTPQGLDEQEISSPQKLQTQLSVQDTIQRHFCQILKNDSLTVTDNTSITETILMRENSTSATITSSRFEQTKRSTFPYQIISETRKENIRTDASIFEQNINISSGKKTSFLLVC